MTNTDEIRRELADISRRLDALPADAYAARIDLRERRSTLRSEARSAALAATPTADLEEDLRRLRGQHGELASRRISPGQVGGGGGPGGGGFDPVVLVNLNAEIDAASGVQDVETLIRDLEREIEARRSST